MKKFKTFSENETIEVGKALGRLLNKGDVVCITGDLGTGKTVITNGIAHSLGIKEYIPSPTFTIVNEYNEKVPLYHFDVYRIADSEEMFEIGFEEYLYGEGIVVIEWGDIIEDILPKEIIRIIMKKDLDSGVDVRIIEIEFIGSRYCDYKNRLIVRDK
ncbi:tRNA (adenosine(37)-N6)-threonylcarbamoyltransferase complex ATPase subunit type 1 TsaE [Herbivorax sp. ANBcel31]|uniref:tRNA (adenosine(37)-N6)-threonylcarbamoyltransferase complex ATPase subunit type 1 TsaE n=1 Tax=Herbivorax sp. ANBcel31 TaxID=3069754 RepID=UPI0027B11C81|nr:tRNA (adenosine(37)-N6)-threonylcarbamoyltransferase complex ATPase subunit type 1 TsaE [Herbivorax sp. ANBcel31]MDQ2086216.1 tRNA (adenosine(37)-N6)-threonylcarbamoyltransferase complex ATPase subunit type 1 TsaE [Herbivorax sp. ANBcel31]